MRRTALRPVMDSALERHALGPLREEAVKACRTAVGIHASQGGNVNALQSAGCPVVGPGRVVGAAGLTRCSGDFSVFSLTARR